LRKIERETILDWSDKIYQEYETQRGVFKELQALYVNRGGGKPPCSLHQIFNYLMTSNDEKTRDYALQLWTRYHELDAKNDAMRDLATALMNVTGSWQIVRRKDVEAV
jgi:hypothetical protein